MKNSLVGIVFNDTIDKYHVGFESHPSFIQPDNFQVNSLTIKKPDGITIKYIDYNGSDFKLDLVEVRDATGKVVYQGNDEEILNVAQIQFDNYLRLIMEAKNKKEQEEAIKKEGEKQEERKRLEEILKILKQ